MSNINQYIHTFYVNAFFFVSGYLLFWKQLSKPKIKEDRVLYISRVGGGGILLNNVIFRIVIPSIIFSAIEFFPSCIIQGRGIDIRYALYKTIGGGTYWFTSALVIAELILLFLFFTRKKDMRFYVIICFILSLVGLVFVELGSNQSGIWAWNQGLLSLAFLALGGLYWQYESIVDKLMCWWLVLPVLSLYIVLVVFPVRYNNPLISTLGIQPLGFITSGIACLLLVWFSKLLPDIKFFSYIGKNSLGFYFMSGAIPIILSIVAHKLVETKVYVELLIWVLSILISYFTVFIINKWLPWLLDIRSLKINSVNDR